MHKDVISKLFDDNSLENINSKNMPGGRGLGMTITKKNVEMMGGTISIDSAKGVGTEFKVTVMLQNSKNKDTSLKRKIDTEVLYVLVVDDDPIEAEHARVVLEEVGIKVEIATSGQEALGRMEVQHAKHKNYNLVLMDWNMPGMNAHASKPVEMDTLIRMMGELIYEAENY